MLKASTGINFKPTKVESGYFLPVDITGSEEKIPAKYFIKNVNYEDDANTAVKQLQFSDRYEKVPLDFAMCRYLAVEKGVACMPCTNFCLEESEHKKHQYIRIAICQPSDKFNSPAMLEKFASL
jgi:aspartate/methionine/tyrosine aminotransferase